MDISHAIAFAFGALGKVLGTWLVHFFNNAIIPYIQRQSNRTISIADEWILNHIGKPADGDGLSAEWRVHIKIDQEGHAVVGSARAICIKGSKELLDHHIEYELSGSYTQNILDIQLTEANRTGLRNRSSLLLQLVGDGNKFDGYRLFLGRTKNQVRAIQCELIRKNSCSECGTA